MILSTKGRYAVMAMVDLARQPSGKPVPLAAIAERQEIPLAYLEQIFARLRQAGLITSARGPGGGYCLARAADAMNVAEIMAASDEPLKMTRCDSHHKAGCMTPKTRCLTHDLWEGLSAQIQHYLESITLGDVAEGRVASGQWPVASEDSPDIQSQPSAPSSSLATDHWSRVTPL